jgi:hypothetical protein
MGNEIATVHRYRGHDEDRFGIPDGTLVAVTEADYDDDKMIVWFTLPDLRNPECSAYLSDIGPELAQIEIVGLDVDPWGMVPASNADVLVIVAAAELRERNDRELLANPQIVTAIRTLLDAGVTADQYAAAFAQMAETDDENDPS